MLLEYGLRSIECLRLQHSYHWYCEMCRRVQTLLLYTACSMLPVTVTGDVTVGALYPLDAVALIVSTSPWYMVAPLLSAPVAAPWSGLDVRLTVWVATPVIALIVSV